MRPVSEAFLRTVRGSHKMVAEALVVAPFQTGVEPDGTVIPIIDGDVELDSTADVRSTLDLTTVGDWPQNPSGLLTPYGPEVFVRRGIEYGNGAREWVSLGYHKVYSVDQDDAPNGPIRLACRDRMAGLIDSKLMAPVQFTRTTTVKQFFDRLVLEVYPTAVIQYDFNAAGTIIDRTVVVEQDRYPAMLDMARAFGCVVYWDSAGRLQVRTPPDATDPVFDVNAGANGVLVTLSRSLNRDGVFNAVVATGEAPDERPPARGVARDMNPISPTFWAGPYGQVPRFYSSPFITTIDQAKNAAASMLAKSIGLPHNVDFTMVPNPALEPLDPIRVSTAEGSRLHVLEKLTIPLTAAGGMSATTREQTGLNIEVGEE